MTKRRDLLKAGAALATTPAIFGGAMLSNTAQAQLCRSEGLRSSDTEPDSPPLRPFIQALYIPPAMQEVDPASLNPPPNTDPPNRHQRFDEYPPRKFYEQHITEGMWNYHPDLGA